MCKAKYQIDFKAYLGETVRKIVDKPLEEINDLKSLKKIKDRFDCTRTLGWETHDQDDAITAFDIIDENTKNLRRVLTLKSSTVKARRKSRPRRLFLPFLGI